MEKINIGLVGFGNVGAGVVKILRDRKRFLAAKTGVEIEVKKICDKDISSKRAVAVDRGLLTRNFSDILSDPNIDIVVELIGGISPAREFVIEALKKGKSIVTANKALLAEHGKQILALANDRNKKVYFEASVGAGIPIIKAIREGLVANNFTRIFGIVNGTSNFVLTEMSRRNRTFKEALRHAQEQGFAEKNPSLDIEGRDSAHKLILLTYLGFGRWVSLDEVFIEGISHVALSDISYAREMGFEIKLLAIAKKEGQELELRVHPTLIPVASPLASVAGVFNAIHVSSDLAGDLIFYGPGAGQFCAASAVVADLVDLTHDIKAGLFRTTLKSVSDESIKKLRKIDDIESRYYIRFTTVDKPGVLAKVSGVLARFGISIASVSQKESSSAVVVPIVVIVHNAREKNLRQALHLIDRFEVIREKSVAIRIEEI